MKSSSLQIHHARILTPRGWINNGSLFIKDGEIVGIDRGDGSGVESSGQLAIAEEPWIQLDAGGRMLLPGFIDLHVHGGGGYDVMKGSADELYGMCRFHASRGTTSLLATTLTASHEEIISALEAAAGAVQDSDREPNGAHLLGIHLEGPFLNQTRCGAQNPEDLREPSIEEFESFWSASQGTIKLMAIAPELRSAEEVIVHAVDRGVTVSLAHTDADYKTMKKAVEWGATQVTHLFNGMRPLHHREPGVAGAALMLDELAVELICDGCHVHPDLVKWVFDIKPEGKVIMITDSMCAAGCPNGEYLLGKLPVLMHNGQVHLKLADGSLGSLAGSSLTMIDALSRTVAFTGKEIADIVPALTIHPAIQIGVQDRKGTIELGKDADMVIIDEEFQVYQTYVQGNRVYDATSR
ncbi:N-acetylglucosamine-6-phosphate deacetylase [Paenibacillus lutimineralis]|uniref:N-acetylglucosamine-6-phosphate deacetylase n=1 Tax=Paenibacillus lutimineralis TaxID=2707005 RepID=A0A3S9UT20_9BACL|nr:N-acetylglucosamine-6-phosphate deacetylase [Paenibacillus lutimineralis]AZS13430.1 N-acetylglucosamine-6-phosphate deacetylase [Paenibacillus lutimineralis]